MTLVLADYTFGEAFLTVLSIFVFAIWLWLLITIIIDLFRDQDLSGWWKAVWVFFLIFVPFLTVLIYLIARGGGMRDRTIAHQRELRQATDQYIRQAATTPADELQKLADLRDKGVISADEFERMKAKVVA
jgi:ABC-type multidrug transport system fused ATPase/permease subunit